MANIESWNPNVPILGKLGSATGQPIVQAYDIQTDENGKRLDEELDGKQEKLPENIGSSSYRVWIVSPQKVSFEKDGTKYSGFEITETKYNELNALDDFKDSVVEYEGKYYYIKPYHFKRVNAHDSGVGIVTFENYKEKAAEQGWTEEYALSKVATHEEPTDLSLVARGPNGSIVIESTPSPYTAVNNKRLEERLTEYTAEVDSKLGKSTVPYLQSTVYSTDDQISDAQRSKKKLQGWYRIAETSHTNGYFSSIFHVNLQVLRTANTSDVVFTAEKQIYNGVASIGILSYSSGAKTNAIDKVRIVYKVTGSSKTAQKAYLEVHINQTSIESDEEAWDKKTTSKSKLAGYEFNVQTLFDVEDTYKWTLIPAQLVSSDIDPTEIESGYSSCEKSPATSSWSQVTASVDDLNNVARKDYVDRKILDLETRLVAVPHNWFSITAYAATGDVDSIDVLLSNAKYLKLDITGSMFRIWNGEVTDELIDAVERIVFDVTLRPTNITKNGDSRWQITCDVPEISASSNSTIVSNITATTCVIAIDVYDDYTYVGVGIDAVADIIVNGEIVSYDFSNNYIDEDLNESSPDFILADIPKNSETEQFFPETATYGLRKQSIINQLWVTLEEAKARREAAKETPDSTSET